MKTRKFLAITLPVSTMIAAHNGWKPLGRSLVVFHASALLGLVIRAALGKE